MMPTFALIAIFLDLGMMFFRWSTMLSAVREGCRYAITFQTASNCGTGGTSACGQDNSIEQTVQQYSLGLVKTTDSPQTIFVKYYAPNNLTTAITTGGNTPGNIVEVSVQNVSYNWMLPALRNLQQQGLVDECRFQIFRLFLGHPWRLATGGHQRNRMNMERYKTSARNHHGERGQEIIEFCVVLVLFVPLVIGSFVTGMSLIRSITAQQVCRDLDSMYMHGGDFSTYSMQQEAQRLAQGMNLQLASSYSGSVRNSDSASGYGLVTATELMYVGPTTGANCVAVGASNCTNHDSFVFMQRIQFGNISGLASTYPSSLGNPGSSATYNSTRHRGSVKPGHGH